MCSGVGVTDADIARARQFPTEVAIPEAISDLRRGKQMLDANNKLVSEGIVQPSQTSLVEYVDSGENSTAARIQALIKEQGRTEPGIISMSESWTDEALRYLRREKHTDKRVKLVALNYANCSYIGGNYSEGGYVRAQEEELCRGFPALFDSMKTCREAGCTSKQAERLTGYAKHVFGCNFQDGYGKARNVLFTEEVQCLRSQDSNYRLLFDDANRVSSGFVEAAAPLFNRGKDYAFQDWRDNPKEWYEKVFLNTFYAPKGIDRRYDVIVIGPWGCGAFGNDPVVVAQSFVNIIRIHQLPFLYKEIHFCLGRSMVVDRTVGGACNRNVDSFKEVFRSLHVDAHDYTEDLQQKAFQWFQVEKEMCSKMMSQAMQVDSSPRQAQIVEGATVVFREQTQVGDRKLPAGTEGVVTHVLSSDEIGMKIADVGSICIGIDKVMSKAAFDLSGAGSDEKRGEKRPRQYHSCCVQ